MSEKVSGPGATRPAATDPLAPWLETPEALAAQILRGETAFADRLDTNSPGYAYVRGDRLGVAVADRRGRVLYANPCFEGAGCVAAIDPDLITEVLRRPRLLITRPEGPLGHRAVEAPAAMAYGPLAMARAWQLPEAGDGAFAGPDDAVAILAITSSNTLEVLTDACRSFGMAPAETRVICGLILTGNLKDAARWANVRYGTARKAVSQVMKRLGYSRQAALIEGLLNLSLGIWPRSEDGSALLADVWGLTRRQAALAFRISVGLSRPEAARATGLSEAVAKKELATVFEVLGVETAAGLSRFITEARALSMLTQTVGSGVMETNDGPEPVRLLRRPDGGRVAFSDYGPRSGAPVLVLHSSTASRPAPRRLVRALHARGYRPIAIDRPGFGLTDPLPGPRKPDPFDGACADVALVCDALGLTKLHVIARGGAQVALALAERRPDLLRTVLLVNPDPPTRPTGIRQGPFEAVKLLYSAYPDLIERFAHTLATRVSMDRVRQVLTRLVEGSPTDQAAMNDPTNYADFVRSIRMFTTGRVSGYVAEQIAMTRSAPPPLAGASAWRVYIGADDSLHDPAHVEAYWRSVLPGATFTTYEDGGRFIAMTHAADIVAGLDQPGPASEAPGTGRGRPGGSGQARPA